MQITNEIRRLVKIYRKEKCIQSLEKLYKYANVYRTCIITNEMIYYPNDIVRISKNNELVFTGTSFNE